MDRARRGLFSTKDQYHQEPCEEKREDVATKKDLLKACYTEVEEEILKGKIRKVEDTADRCKNKESWNLVNDISGISTKLWAPRREQLYRTSRELEEALLWSTWTTTHSSIPIRSINPPLNIEDGLFTIEELRLAKKQIVEGKAYGE